MKLFFFGLLVTVVYSKPKIDPAVLDEIFGTPPTPAPGNENLTTITPPSSTTTTENNEKPLPTVPTSEVTNAPTVPTSGATYVPTVFTSEDIIIPDVGATIFVPTVPTSEETIVPTVGAAIFVPTVPTSGATNVSTVPTYGVTIVPTVPTSTVKIDKDILDMIFEVPLTPIPINTTIVKEKDIKSNTILYPYVEGDKPCHGYCVPFYECDTYKSDGDDGAGILMARSGYRERSCEKAEDVCCSVPFNSSKINTQLRPVKTLKCGYRNPGGVGTTPIHADTQFGEFPWVVPVLDEKWSYLGVGVLISPLVVMTAAHIAANYTTGNNRLRIRAGEWDSQARNEIFPFQERVVKEIFIHKDFNKIDRRSNNIALLRFEQPLELSEYVNAICMPEQDEVFDHYKSCIANGWGKDIFGLKGRYAVILKKVELNIVPYSRCSILLKNTRLGSRFRLHSSFLCAGGEENEDTCEGDGGAPLACPIGDNRYKLTGLVAWGVGCGQKDVPGVYTNVPRFRQWVDNTMADWGLSTEYYNI